MIKTLSLLAISVAAIIFFSHRLLGYLRHFQESGYNPTLYKNWLLANRVYDKKGSLIAVLAAIAVQITKEVKVGTLLICTIAMAAFIYLSLWEGDPRKVGYPLLVPTTRVTAIYGLGLCLYSLSFVLGIATIYHGITEDNIAAYWLLAVVAIQSSPLWLFLANTIVRSLKLQ